jgi:2'-5' RNA ligase
MSCADLYHTIYITNKSALLSGNIKLDDVLSSRKKDMRTGISLIVPVKSIEKPYDHIVTLLKQNEPGQYYYPLSDLHITIFDFLQASDTYKRDIQRENKFIEITEKVLEGFKEFTIALKGVVFSKEAGIIQGFDNNRLVTIRNNIRLTMEHYGIINNERYISESAHITFCRFKKTLNNHERLMRFIDEYREYDMGKEKINHIELVEHDWYNKETNKRVIKAFHTGLQ